MQVSFLHVGNSALYIISITLIMYVNTEIAFHMYMCVIDIGFGIYILCKCVQRYVYTSQKW